MEASDDHSKIIRIDYQNMERMREAQAAQAEWKTGSFAPFYRPVGRLVAYETDSERQRGIDQNREQLHLERRPRGGKDPLQKFYGDTCTQRPLTIVHNPDDAMVDWKPCVLEHEDKAKWKCCQSGGSVHETKVEVLEHDGTKVTAIVLANRDSIDTSQIDVVLATGAWTLDLLQVSGIELPPEERRPTPTGVFAVQLKLSDEQVRVFRNKPILSENGRGA